MKTKSRKTRFLLSRDLSHAPVVSLVRRKPWMLGAATVVVIFSIIGVAYLANSGAATYTTQMEAEAGSISGNASRLNGVGASGGQAVSFSDPSGGNPTTPPAPPPPTTNPDACKPDPQKPTSPAPTAPTNPNPGVPTRLIKLMPLGSSTIVGVTANSFRGELYQRLTQEDRLYVDFVGSQGKGDASLPDKDHEGHGGWQIGAEEQDLNGRIIACLNIYQPDIIIFYAGTNDIRGGASPSTTVNRLDAIASKIFNHSPNVKLIVGKLILPLPLDGSLAADCRTFNDSIEPVAVKYRAQGRYMQIIDVGGVVGVSDHADSLHANESGNDKMADVWLEGVRATYPTF